MSKTNDALLINEGLKKNIFKMLTIAFEVSECAEKNCSLQKKNIMADKKTAALYTNFKGEQDIKKKLKLGEQYSENDITYEYNKCLMKHCNKTLINLMKLYRSIISTIPKSNPKRKKLDKIIDELELLVKKSQLNRNEYKIYLKNMAELMFIVKKQPT
jgi:hypothetical protein